MLRLCGRRLPRRDSGRRRCLPGRLRAVTVAEDAPAAGPSRPLRIGFVAALATGVPVILLLVWPEALGAQRVLGVAQMIAFRGLLAVALAVSAAVVAVVMLLRRRWGVAAGVALVLAVSSVGNGAVLFQRGATGGLPEGGLVVMSWNTQGGATSPRDVARLAVRVHADVVALPETDAVAATEVARLMQAQGGSMTRVTAGDRIPTSVLVSDRLGRYRADWSVGTTPGLPSLVVRPVGGQGPTIVTAHPAPPLPGSMRDWRSGLGWVAARCDGPDVIVAGDFNATVDHLQGLGAGGGLVGACRDAALEAGSAAAGTWPSTRPGWAAAPIDHVMAGPAWVVRGFQAVETGGRGSDHRPVVAVLARN